MTTDRSEPEYIATLTERCQKYIADLEAENKRLRWVIGRASNMLQNIALDVAGWSEIVLVVEEAEDEP